MDEKNTSRDVEPVRDLNGKTDDSFERKLEDLILRAFGEGEEIEGVWDIEYAPDEIPDWTVTIDRKDGF